MPAQFPLIFSIAAIVLVAIAATLVALYAWMTSPTKVLDEIDALAEGTGRAAAVAIGRSLKRRRA